MTIHIRFYYFSLLCLFLLMDTLSIHAQTGMSFTDGLGYNIEMQSSVSNDRTPLWMNANKYGLSSLEGKNGYVRAGIMKPLKADSIGKWGLGYGLDMAVVHHYTSNVVIQQAFVEMRWLKGVLTVGSKEQPVEMKNMELSSGGQTLGINARPVPQVRIALPDYWTVPLTNRLVSIKGHIAYGLMTDDNWQQNFAAQGSKYEKDVIYHSKAEYVKFGDEKRWPLTVEAGLEMATIFGGKVYRNGREYKYSSGIKNFIKALIPFDDKDDNSLYTAEGNQLGSALLSVSYKFPSWKIRAYTDHFFEDGSAMYLLDYDGYGSGADWDKHSKNRYVLYNPKDGMYGVEVTMPKNRIVSSIVTEYLYTKYQSGPIYHDHSEYISDHIGGRDDYYNHGTYTGWQHWGQVIGNPLYLSPVYNEDRLLTIKDNRFVAWHVGVCGNPCRNIHYRVLLTTQKGWGTYSNPYSDVKRNTSFLAEVRYDFLTKKCASFRNGWSVKGAFAFDRGSLLGNNTGMQISILKSGILKH